LFSLILILVILAYLEIQWKSILIFSNVLGENNIRDYILNSLDTSADKLAIIFHLYLSPYLEFIKNDPFNPNKFNFNVNSRLMLIKLTYPLETYIINTYNQDNNHLNFVNIKDISLLILRGDLNYTGQIFQQRGIKQ
jgi:hypothetical protein